jgi:hypothetical protein
MKSIQSKIAQVDKGLFIGLFAILVNIITVTVYMYQANIMRIQQHASAWPYLEWLPSYNEDQYSIAVSNNGIGPALIQSVELKLNGQPMPNIDAVFEVIMGTSYFPHLISTIENRVLPANASLKLFEINDDQWAGKVFAAMQANKFEFEICYQSIYGDAWTCKGTQVIESTCK